MKLKRLIEALSNVKKVEGKASLEIKGLSCDSKSVKDAYVFIAIKGARFNGEDFINEAIDRGAYAVVLEYDKTKTFSFTRGVTFIYVNDARRALSEIAMAFYGDVSARMRLIGVTGTNGKTTTTYLLEGLFDAISEKAGIIGTINYRFGNRLIPASNTTPGALGLYSLLSNMQKEKVKNCILEVSSHSLDQGRVDGLSFDIAIFTNLTSEHLDYHKDMENYFASKAILFTKIKQGGYAIINKDDPYAERIIKKVRSDKKADVITYGIEQEADVSAREIKFSTKGLRFKLRAAGGSIEITSRLIGRHNAYNILAAASAGITIGMDLSQIRSGIEKIVTLPGRLEKIDCGQDFLVFVDYAHTGNGLENALKTVRELKPKRILTVFGCGGDRDKSKRPEMGRISSELSDKIFITSDNPRNEEPLDIIKQIIKSIAHKKNYVVEVDRLKAIEEALKEAKKGDVVLVAGKGHETYQVFKDVTLPFDDRQEVRRILTKDA